VALREVRTGNPTVIGCADATSPFALCENGEDRFVLPVFAEGAEGEVACRRQVGGVLSFMWNSETNP
jgi:hypothetical protein